MEAVSIGWKCRGQCKGFVDMGGVFHAHKEKPFLPIMTNADRIRAMSDEELAVFQANRYAEAIFREKADNGVSISGTDKKALVADLYQVWLRYLRQPAEED